MQLIRDICRGDGCGILALIVNRKYYLCDDCNFKRIHNGKTKQEVYSERAKERGGNNPSKTAKKVDESLLGRHVYKASKLKSVSSEKRYRTSSGELVSQAEIKWRLCITTDKIKQVRPPICEGLGRGGLPLSFSHTISQARCKELGKTELIWDEGNIELESFEAPTSNPVMAHNIWESPYIERKIMLLNFERKLTYIKQHDEETYTKLVLAIEKLDGELE